MRSEQEVCRAVETYADMVRRICFYYLKNREDTEDVFQKVFMKYMMCDAPFRDSEHEKAWLLRVTINACKDDLRNFFRRNTLPLETITELEAEIPEDFRDVLEAVLSLPEKYKNPIYLHYYEGYSAAEIGAILGKKENTVYSLLSRGRRLLKDYLKDCPSAAKYYQEKTGGEGIGE